MDSKQKENVQASPNIHTMPDEFYGGKDPVVHYKKQTIVIEDSVPAQAAVPKPPALPPPPLSAPVPAKEARLSFWQKRKNIILSVIGIVLLTAGVSAYYLWQAGYFARPIANTLPPPPTFPNIPPTVSSTVPETPPSTTTTTESAPTSTVDITNLPIDFPSTLFTDSADLDADALTDTEEEIFKTDSGAYDTDLDGYYDGLEVVNLYNPGGTAPMKIIDSGVVQEYSNPTYKYRLYYPTVWNMAPVDPHAEQVLFSSITGDFIEVRAVPREIGESFSEWFAREAKGQLFTDVSSSTNRFLVEVWSRKDGAVVYVPYETNVFVLLYHPLSASAVPFRHVMQMIAQSFRPAKTLIDIPAQASVPALEASSTSLGNSLESLVLPTESSL